MSWVAVSVGLTAVGAGVSAGGTILGGMSKAKGDAYAGTAAETGAEIKATALEEGGTFAQNEAEYQAKQYDQLASDARVAGQRDAFERRRTAKLALSTLVARAASGGGAVTDPTVLNLASQIGQRGEYLALSDMWKGQEKAAGYENEATAARYSGAAKKYAADLEATGVRYLGAADKYAYGLKSTSDVSSSWLSAGGTILSAGGTIAGKFGGGGTTKNTVGAPLSLDPKDYG